MMPMGPSLAPLFQRLTHGVYVIGVNDGSTFNAFTAAWVMQVSFDPLLLALAINPAHSSFGLLRDGQAFSVNVLGSGHLALAERFGRPAGSGKLAAADWAAGQTGSPLLREAIAWFECRVTQEHPAGDHVLVVGQAIAGGVRDPDAQPMTYRETGTMDGAAALFPPAFPAA
jgi:flavin reductase (DIM6/NTAB) family NADH-FMN oxidoreductase RutF